MTMDPRAVMRRAEQLKAERQNHESHWEEVAQHLLPHRSFTSTPTPGTKRREFIFNTMPVAACEQLAAGLHGMLTGPSVRWFALRPLPDAAPSKAAKVWFDQATDVMYATFQSSRAGFATALHENYTELAAFGNCVHWIADRRRAGLTFRAVPIQQSYWAENADGRIDTLYRCFPLPARMVLQTWPDTCPPEIARQAEARPDAPVDIIHAVEPSRRAGTWDGCYVTRGQWLEAESYREFPYACARWSREPGDIYGVGPGMNALPDIKMLNMMERTDLRLRARYADPPRFLPHDGFLSEPNFNPGAFNYYDSATWRSENRVFTDQPGRPDLIERKIEQVQDRLAYTFYTAWLRLPQQPNMTATEVLQRRDEYLRLLGPFVTRLTDELLNPIIERTFAILLRNFRFPPPPPEVRGWTVEYMGPLAQAQRAQQAETVMRVLAAGQTLLQADPAVLQNLDANEAFRFVADRVGAPAALVRTREEVEQLRAQQQQMQQDAAMAATLRQGAGAAKDGAQALATVAGLQQGGNVP